MIRSLLVSDCLPSPHYGTGHRLLTLQRALTALGECKVLHLTNHVSAPDAAANFLAPMPFDLRSSRAAWTIRNLSFAEARRSESHRPVFERIRREFPFNLTVCSFFRNACVIPTDMAPSLLDLDAMREPHGPLARALWPFTLMAMRRRAKDFRALYVIRRSDLELFDGYTNPARVIPGISSCVPAKPLAHNPQANRILFVAPTIWPPNLEAIEWLLALDTPQKLHNLGYELRLVGSGTETFASRPGLSCGGFVDDLGEEYAAARLVLCPISSGTGANIKLAEAVQFGRAVLATRHSAQAFDGFLRANEDLLIFDQPSEFIDILVGILQDSARLQALENRAKQAADNYLNQSYINRIIAEDVARVRQPTSGSAFG